MVMEAYWALGKTFQCLDVGKQPVPKNLHSRQDVVLVGDIVLRQHVISHQVV